MAQYVLWQQQVAYPAQQDRQLLGALKPFSGAFMGMAVTVGTGRVVNIAPGSFVVALSGTNGSALCISDAAATATFAAAPGSGSSRIDLLVCTVHDPTIDAGSTNGFTFDVVLGTASSSPVPPATPANAGVLAQVTSVGGQANLAQSNIVPADIAAGIYGTATLTPGTGNMSNNAQFLAGTANALRGVTYVSPNFGIQHAGLYLVTYAATMNGNGGNPATAYFQGDVYKNGAATQAGMHAMGFMGPWPSISFSDQMFCVPGDTLAPTWNGAGMTAACALSNGRFSVTRIM
jgi:hypothetical protein